MSEAASVKKAPMQMDYTTSIELKQEWGDFLAGLANWDWFVTLTLRNPDNPQFPLWTKPGWGTAKKAWRDFTSRARPALGRLQWVMMFELQKWRGVPHIHALVAGSDCRRMEMVDWAWNRWGITRVLAYDPQRGARFYLCKYLTKDIADIDFSVGLEKKSQLC